MTEDNEELDYEQLVTLWNIAGKPDDAENLVPMLNAASLRAEKRFLAKSKANLVETLLEDGTALSERTYEILAHDRRVTIRRLVAQDYPPISILRELSTSPDVLVRTYVAGNSDTPLDVLSTLAQDAKMSVLLAVASNTHTPNAVLDSLTENMLTRMAKHKESRNSWVTECEEGEIVAKCAENANQTNEATLAHICAFALADIEIVPFQTPRSRHACHGSSRLLTPVTDNPHTSIDTLIDILDTHSGASYAIRDHIIAEVSQERSDDDRALIARNSMVRVDQLDELFMWDSSSTVRASVPHNPRITLDQLRTLAEDPEPSVRREVQQVLGSVVDNIASLGESESPRTYVPLVFNPDEFALALDNSVPWSERYSVFAKYDSYASRDHYNNLMRVLLFSMRELQDEGKILEFIEQYWNSDNGDDLTLLAAHPLASAEFLQHVSRFGREPLLGKVLAQSPNTPSAVLAALADNADDDVRLLVANHPNTSAEVLALLADDESDDIRLAVVAHPNALPSTISNLAIDEAVLVRIQVALRSQDDGVLTELLNDVHQWVSEVVEARDLYATSPERLSALAVSNMFLVRWCVTRHPSVTTQTLDLLSHDPESAVRREVAENINTEQLNTLLILATDDVSDVVASVALHDHPRIIAHLRAVSTDPLVLRILRAKEGGLSVSEAEAFAIDEDWRVRFKMTADPNLSAHVLATLAEDEVLEVRSGVGANPSTPSEVLAQLAHDEEWPVRQGVAENPNTPLATLQELLDHEDAEVREQAQANLGARS